MSGACEGWIWSPEFLNIFKRIKIRKRETFHPDREKIGDKFKMPILSQIDVQGFIERFSKTPKEEKAKEVKPSIEIKETMPDVDVVALRNKYESELLQKDVEIRSLKSIIGRIRILAGGNAAPPEASSSAPASGNTQMWLEKLGGGGASRILKLLAEKSGMKFTRSQIGLAVGLSSKSGSFATYISTLKRNKLIIEQNKELWVNPDL